MTLLEKLQYIQSNLKVPKNQYSVFGKYRYRSCEDIQEGVKPLLKETKTVLTVSDEIIQIGDRYYVKATAKLLDCESESFIENVAYAREEESKKGMDASQVTGATSSYARKYALNGLFCIDDNKDADSMDNSKKEEYKHDELVGVFHKEIQRTGKSLKWFLDKYKVTNAKYIKSTDLLECIEMLKQLPNKE